MHSQAADLAGTRGVYRAPTLKVFGGMAALTATGTRMGQENTISMSTSCEFDNAKSMC